jgi:hypothetical protein
MHCHVAAKKRPNKCPVRRFPRRTENEDKGLLPDVDAVPVMTEIATYVGRQHQCIQRLNSASAQEQSTRWKWFDIKQ